MSNNAAGLNAFLTTALRDSAYATWTTGEMDNLISWSVARLFPRFPRQIDASSGTAAEVTLVASTYYYGLPSGMVMCSRIDLKDASANYLGPISGRAWEITGDPLLTTGKIHISPQIVDNYVGGKLVCHGYGRYDVTTSLIPDDLVPLVLARARAEAYRRVGADRERFKAWLSRNQSQNVSINELLQMINEADLEAKRLEQTSVRIIQKPVSGRVG